MHNISVTMCSVSHWSITPPHSTPLTLSHPALPHTLTQPFLTLSPNPSSLSHPALPHNLTQPFLTLSHPTLPHSLSPSPSSQSHPTLTHSLSPNPSSPFFYSHSPSSSTQLGTPSNLFSKHQSLLDQTTLLQRTVVAI